MKIVRKPDKGIRNPVSIVSYRVPFTPSNNKSYSNEVDLRYHPTQKPLDLCEYLIKTFSNEDELVLDNCIGSGTTAIACINTNRNFIGMELNESYFNLANDRIQNIV